MKRGIVVATHPEDHSVDIVLSDGRRLVGVQIATANGSTRSGVFDMPAVPAKVNKWDISTPTGQDQIALVDFIDGFPVVMGFLYSQVSQMTFDDPKRRVTRHQSDVMSSIDGDGNIQIQHPSGLYIRIGETTELDNLEGKNTDKNLSLDRNKAKRVSLHIQTASGTTKVTITPDGAISFVAEEGFTVTAPSVILDTPMVSVPHGDVVASGVSLVHHVHGGVIPGPSNTGQPA